MAQLAMAAMVAGSVLQAGGTLAAGNAAVAEADFQKHQFDMRADEERAASQREVLQQRGETNRIISRQQAVAASSGLGALDPTILDLAGDVAQEGAYREGMLRYGGESRARGLETQGQAAVFSAKNARRAGRWAAAGEMFKAMGTIAGGGGEGDMFSKYGGGGPPTSEPMNLTSFTRFPMYG